MLPSYKDRTFRVRQTPLAMIVCLRNRQRRCGQVMVIPLDYTSACVKRKTTSLEMKGDLTGILCIGPT